MAVFVCCVVYEVIMFPNGGWAPVCLNFMKGEFTSHHQQLTLALSFNLNIYYFLLTLTPLCLTTPTIT